MIFYKNVLFLKEFLKKSGLSDDLNGILPVLRIRIRIQIRMVLGLLDPDPLVRGMDPDLAPDPKILRKTLSSNV